MVIISLGICRLYLRLRGRRQSIGGPFSLLQRAPKPLVHGGTEVRGPELGRGATEVFRPAAASKAVQRRPISAKGRATRLPRPAERFA